MREAGEGEKGLLETTSSGKSARIKQERRTRTRRTRDGAISIV